jgi:hypothetical protein
LITAVTDGRDPPAREALDDGVDAGTMRARN